MNIVAIRLQAARGLVGLLLAIAFIHPAYGTRLVEETFPVLKTRTGTYTNVTVTTRADSYIFILHSTGMTSIRIPDLPVDVRRQLGYPTPDAPVQAATANTTISVDAKDRPNTDPGTISQDQAAKDFRARMLQLLAASKINSINSEARLTFLAIWLLVYLFFSFCCSQICSKAGEPGGILVWLPILKVFPMLRAANMSGWWFLVCFVPGGSLLLFILWAINITKARGKEIWVAVLLIVPLTTPFTFLYLAFSSSAPVYDSPASNSKFQSRGLQTA
jgi:hypothetical protein